MAMFTGKISSERKKAPRRLSNALPENHFFRNSKIFKKSNSENQESDVEVIFKTSSFDEFFNLKVEKEKETA